MFQKLEKQLVLLLFLACLAHAQGIRWDLGAPGSAGVVTITGGSGYPPIRAVPNATLSFCSSPAIGKPCTNTVQTYTNATLVTACPANAQVVLQGSSTCQATGASDGSMGVWIQTAGTYTYTLTVNGVSSIPYTVSVGSTSGGGGGSAALPISGDYSGPVTSVANQSTVGATVVNSLPVIQHSHDAGAGQTFAYLNSDISGNAATATAFDHTPTQSSSFCNGIAANGDCQSNNTNILSMPETSCSGAAASNGALCFDITNHVPYYSQNGGGYVALGATYANLANTDLLASNSENILEQSATTNPQEFRSFKNRTSNTNYAFLSTRYDASSTNFVISASWDGTNELTKGIALASGTGAAPTQRWEMSPSTYNWRPVSAASNTEGVGGSANLVDGLFLGDEFSTGVTAGLHAAMVNDAAAGGTTVNLLAKAVTLTNDSTAIKAGTGDTTAVLGVVVAGAGTTLKASLTQAGYVSCTFDGSTVAGDYVQASTSTAGDCHDAGSAMPQTGQIIGRVVHTRAGVGLAAMLVQLLDRAPTLLQQTTGANVTTTSTSSPPTPVLYTYTLPATQAAKTYSWTCKLYYQSSVGTAGLNLGVNSSVNPTSMLHHARIYSTLTGTATDAAVTTTTSGVTLTLAGANADAGATTYEADLDGTVEEPVAGGTLAFNYSATSAATITILRGSYCQVWVN